MSLHGRQLGRWLMREIHGIETPRAPRRKTSPGKPARNWKYRCWIRSLPCAGCGTSPAEAHHTGDHGLSQRASDYTAIPLCADCHTQAPYAYHRVGRQEWERLHGVDVDELVERLCAVWFRAKVLDV